MYDNIGTWVCDDGSGYTMFARSFSVPTFGDEFGAYWYSSTLSGHAKYELLVVSKTCHVSFNAEWKLYRKLSQECSHFFRSTLSDQLSLIQSNFDGSSSVVSCLCLSNKLFIYQHLKVFVVKALILVAETVLISLYYRKFELNSNFR